MEANIRYCKCGVLIPEARLKILPTTHTCVNCSDAKPKKPVIVQRGEGDHTYTETVILDHDDYVRYTEEENKFRKRTMPTIQTDLSELNNHSVNTKTIIDNKDNA
jgi:hypothetical protein